MLWGTAFSGVLHPPRNQRDDRVGRSDRDAPSLWLRTVSSTRRARSLSCAAPSKALVVASASACRVPSAYSCSRDYP